MANKRLRLLVVDNSEDDALLIVRDLENSGRKATWRRVNSASQLEDALGESSWDIAFTDYSLPGFGGREALRIIRRDHPDLPVIVVSGSSGQQEAIEMFRAGAKDYFVKGRIGLLSEAVERELKDAEVRTARKNAEISLRKSETRYRTIFNSTADGIFLLDEKGTIIDANRVIAERLGYTPDELQGKTVMEIDDPESASLAFKRIDQVYRTGFELFEVMHVTRDGRVIPTEISYRLITLEERPVLIAIARDIMERKKTEACRQTLYHIADVASKAMDLQMLYRKTHEAIGHSISARNFFIALYDSESEILSFPYWEDEMVPRPESGPVGRGLPAYVLRTGKPILVNETLYAELEKGGEAVMNGTPSKAWLGVPLKVDQTIIGIMAVQNYKDESAYGRKDLELLEFVSSLLAGTIDRSRSVKTLRKSEARYRTIFENSPAALYRTTIDGKYLSLNPAMAAIFGFNSPEEIMLHGSVVHLYQTPQDRENFLKDLRKEGRLVNYEKILIKADGSPIWVLENTVLVRDEDGSEIIEGYALDITEQKRDREERVLLAAAMEQTNEGMLCTDFEGRIIYSSAGMERLTGYKKMELTEADLRELVDEEGVPVLHRMLWLARVSMVSQRERTVLVGRDGTPRTYDATINSVRNRFGKIYAFIFTLRDVSKEVELAVKLNRSRELETIGMIAGGMAHEVRNPLFAITTLVAAAEKNFADTEGLKEYLDMIKEQAEHLSLMMKDVLTLGQPILLEEFEPCSLQEAASDALTVLEQSRPEARNSVVVEAPSSPLLVSGQLEKLSEVIMNIVGNALHFSPPEGKVTVRLRREGDSAVVEVLDEGPGIPEDFLPDLFKPFRSMRQSGTGLGLAIVRKIIETHGGAVIGANRVPGPGAVFTVTLPIEGDGHSKA